MYYYVIFVLFLFGLFVAVYVNDKDINFEEILTYVEFILVNNVEEIKIEDLIDDEYVYLDVDDYGVDIVI